MKHRLVAPDRQPLVRHNESEKPKGIETATIAIGKAEALRHNESENPIGIETERRYLSMDEVKECHNESENPIGIETLS